MTEFRRVPLKTGVTLNVALAGDAAAPAVILLHGFPESHRTWRAVAPLLEDRFRLVMPDQRLPVGPPRGSMPIAPMSSSTICSHSPIALSIDLSRLSDTTGAGRCVAAEIRATPA